MFARTERLLLRPSWPEDAAAVYRAVADEGIVRNLASAPWPYTPADAACFVGLEPRTMYPNFMLMLRTDGAPKLIGSCGIAELQGDVELGYWVAREHWGHGFAAEAAKAVVGVAKALGHKKLVAGHFTDNPASGRVLRKIGFRPLGRIEHRYSAGRGQDMSCALFELPLTDEADDAPSGVSINRMRPLQQMMQAA
jgi:RimJ/RimL family protein N-acetyltransferase